MKSKYSRLFFISLFLFSGTSYSCQFDTDCKVGSICSKSSGNIYGYCVGGLNPGNQNDKRPARNPLDITGKKGNSCSFDTDCGVGGKCRKSSYSIKGICQ